MKILIAITIFIIIYFPISLPISSVVRLPNIVAALLATVGVVMAVIRGFEIKRHQFQLIILVLYLVISCAFCYSREVEFMERAKSSLVLIYSFYLAAGLFFFFKSFRIQASGCGWWLHIISIILLILAALEPSTVIGEVSDSFRNVVYDESKVYSADARDFALAGGIRPKVFASEPSFAAFAIGTLTLIGFYMGGFSAASFYCSVASMIACILLFSSPIPLGHLISLIGCKFVNLRSVAAIRNKYFVGAVLMVIIAIIVPLIILMVPALSTRYNAIVNGEDRSGYRRLVLPVEMSLAALEKNPLFGVGFGGESELGDMLYLDHDMLGMESHSLLNSGLASILIFGGLSGVVMFFFWMINETKRVGSAEKVLILAIVGVCLLSVGSVQASPHWVVVAILLGVRDVSIARNVVSER